MTAGRLPRVGAPAWRDLQTMTFDELIERHDRIAQTTDVGLNHYLLELNRRIADRQARQMVKLTRIIAALTVANVVLVAANVWLD